MSGTGDKLSVRSMLLGDKCIPWRPQFIDQVRLQYHAEFKHVDYVNDPEVARSAMNQWLSDETKQDRDRSRELQAIDSTAGIVLMSAVRMNDRWKTPFQKDESHLENFKRRDGTEKMVMMMFQQHKHKYYENEHLKMLCLPLSDGRIEMIFLLPSSNDELPRLEKDLAQGKLDDWIGKLNDDQEVHVGLPRFTISKTLDSGSLCNKLGINVARSPFNADFTGMYQKSDKYNLYLHSISHNAMLAVDEDGVKASSESKAWLYVFNGHELNVKEFVANRPFVFLIRDGKFSTILFMGRFEGDAIEEP